MTSERLPTDARKALAGLRAVAPEVADIAARLYPSAERDEAIRLQRQADAERDQRKELARRRRRAQEALDGEHGREVQAAARAELAECGSELNQRGIDAILAIVREAERARPRKDPRR